MKIEKWKFKGKEVNVPVLEDDEIETNEEIKKELDKTVDLTKTLKNIEAKNE